MKCGGWRIFDFLIAIMENPLRVISAGFLSPAIFSVEAVGDDPACQ